MHPRFQAIRNAAGLPGEVGAIQAPKRGAPESSLGEIG